MRKLYERQEREDRERRAFLRRQLHRGLHSQLRQLRQTIPLRLPQQRRRRLPDRNIVSNEEPNAQLEQGIVPTMQYLDEPYATGNKHRRRLYADRDYVSALEFMEDIRKKTMAECREAHRRYGRYGITAIFKATFLKPSGEEVQLHHVLAFGLVENTSEISKRKLNLISADKWTSGLARKRTRNRVWCSFGSSSSQ